MIPVQQPAQQFETAKAVLAVIAVATVVYWRLMLRLLLILAAVAVAVGAVALLQLLMK
jgi:hypothetical protein